MVSDEHIVCSTPVHAGGFFPDFLPDLSQTNYPSSIKKHHTQCAVQKPVITSKAQINEMARAALFSLRQKSIQNPSVATVIDLESYKVEETARKEVDR